MSSSGGVELAEILVDQKKGSSSSSAAPLLRVRVQELYMNSALESDELFHARLIHLLGQTPQLAVLALGESEGDTDKQVALNRIAELRRASFRYFPDYPKSIIPLLQYGPLDPVVPWSWVRLHQFAHSKWWTISALISIFALLLLGLAGLTTAAQASLYLWIPLLVTSLCHHDRRVLVPIFEGFGFWMSLSSAVLTTFHGVVMQRTTVFGDVTNFTFSVLFMVFILIMDANVFYSRGMKIFFLASLTLYVSFVGISAFFLTGEKAKLQLCAAVVTDLFGIDPMCWNVRTAYQSQAQALVLYLANYLYTLVRFPGQLVLPQLKLTIVPPDPKVLFPTQVPPEAGAAASGAWPTLASTV
jgi:hypothetical protein